MIVPRPAPDPDPPPLLVSKLQAARLLGVSPGTVENLLRRGELASVKLGARRLYEVAELQRLIARSKRGAP